nr:hypothetical protein BaRGS_006291 [Batillaria attramentaria]
MSRLALLALSLLMVSMESAWSHEALSREQLTEELQKLNSKMAALEDRMMLSVEIKNLGDKLTASIEKLGGTLPTANSSESRCPTTGGGGQSSAVAFSARFADDNQDNGIALGHHSVLRFDHVITNIGNGYNPQTGIFTAPVSGVYVFFLSFMSVYNKGYVMLVIDKHGEELDTAYANDKTKYDQGSTEVTTHLTVGEKLWVRQQLGTAVRGSTWTIFTGYLIHED